MLTYQFDGLYSFLTCQILSLSKYLFPIKYKNLCLINFINCQREIKGCATLLDITTNTNEMDAPVFIHHKQAGPQRRFQKILQTLTSSNSSNSLHQSHSSKQSRYLYLHLFFKHAAKKKQILLNWNAFHWSNFIFQIRIEYTWGAD